MSDGELYEFDSFRLDPAERLLLRDGEPVPLEPKVFETLVALVRRGGRLVGKDELMREVWQTTFWTSGKTIDVHLGWLRRKLGDDTRNPTLITTVRGQGLRFETGAAPRRPGLTPGTSPQSRAS